MRIGLQLTRNREKYALLLQNIQSQIHTQENIEFIHIADENELRIQIPGLDVLMCYKLEKVNFSLRSSCLKWIHFGVSGVDKSLFPELINSDVIVTNARGIHSGPVSEFMIGMMLYLAKRFQNCEGFRSTGKWKQWEIAEQTVQLSGKCLGIIGYGAIGKELADKATALGMKVIALNRSGCSGSKPEAVQLHRYNDLEMLLPVFDFLAVACPLTHETEKLICRQSFRQMKSSAFFINAARGGIVDELSLIWALEHGEIAGAALDVYTTEPLAPDSPLFKLDNVFLSPHISGNFPEYQDIAALQFGKNLDRYLREEKLFNVVNKIKGY